MLVDFLNIGLLICLVIYVTYYWVIKYDYMENGGVKYKVLSKFNDKDEAAEKLAEIDQKNAEFVSYMWNKYQYKPDTHGYNIAQRLRVRWQPNKLDENDPPDKHNTSFTEDKGKLIALCLREKVTGYNRLHNDNILEFVNLHELAHVASIGYGHDDEFWENFAFILKEAHRGGFHTPKDYSKNPINYCGLDVSYNPFYDSSLGV
jgi:hypothetical protein